MDQGEGIDMHTRSIATVLLAGLLWLALPCSAEAAESYDSCKGYITSLPATISTPGTWCLKQNLSSLASTGSGINITAKDVTLDCNDFLLDNSVVGVGTWWRTTISTAIPTPASSCRATAPSSAAM